MNWDGASERLPEVTLADVCQAIASGQIRAERHNAYFMVSRHELVRLAAHRLLFSVAGGEESGFLEIT
ncbi:MAG: hypothetical protein HY331_17915 [Chloroflexi bacterium]|nr:hypothetical protein [Chloroflexota bacterium]